MKHAQIWHLRLGYYLNHHTNNLTKSALHLTTNLRDQSQSLSKFSNKFEHYPVKES